NPAPRRQPSPSTYCPPHSFPAYSVGRSSRPSPSFPHSPRTRQAATTVMTLPTGTTHPMRFRPVATPPTSHLTHPLPLRTCQATSLQCRHMCRHTATGKTRTPQHRTAALASARPSASEVPTLPATIRHHRRRYACATRHHSRSAPPASLSSPAPRTPVAAALG